MRLDCIVPTGCERLLCVFRELKTLSPNQHFAFSAKEHLDMAKSPGILGYLQSGFVFMYRVLVFLIPIGRPRMRPKHLLMCKVISENWQIKIVF